MLQTGAPNTPMTSPAPAPKRPRPRRLQIPGIVDNYYAKLLANNPMYKQQQANIGAASAGAAAQRSAAMQALMVNFGQVPEGFTDPYGDVSDLTRGLAGQSTAAGLSTYAQLGKARDQNKEAIIDDLASRGMLDSGDTGYKIGQNQQQYMVDLSDAEKELLQQLTDYASQFSQGEVDRANQGAEAAAQAMDEILATNPVAPNDMAKLVQIQGANPNWYKLGGTLYGGKGQQLDVAALRQRALDRLRAMRESGVSQRQRHRSRSYARAHFLKGFV